MVTPTQGTSDELMGLLRVRIIDVNTLVKFLKDEHGVVIELRVSLLNGEVKAIKLEEL